MKNKALLVALAIVAVAAGVVIHRTMDDRASRISGNPSQPNSPSDTHSASASPSRVPAYQSPFAAQTLRATLAPAQFIGKTRDAYKAAKEIPKTIAQLPCYCHCDEGFGHKSLHSCFEDDHASHCAVCVDEALLAYRLEKEQRLTPEQVRKIIIEKYAAE
ncbi:MAG: PCYCGC domain-containing protein [Acidobacteriota bacterium]|nr:PCYCGC domain-containing protein [Acidobacteriota bacterium]